MTNAEIVKAALELEWFGTPDQPGRFDPRNTDRVAQVVCDALGLDPAGEPKPAKK